MHLCFSDSVIICGQSLHASDLQPGVWWWCNHITGLRCVILLINWGCGAKYCCCFFAEHLGVSGANTPLVKLTEEIKLTGCRPFSLRSSFASLFILRTLYWNAHELPELISTQYCLFLLKRIHPTIVWKLINNLFRSFAQSLESFQGLFDTNFSQIAMSIETLSLQHGS